MKTMERKLQENQVNFQNPKPKNPIVIKTGPWFQTPQ